MARKAMLGHRVRRLRRRTNLTQAQMADRLGISPSYLNLIENNHRPVTVDLLLKLGQSFDVDLQSFAEDEETRLVSALYEVVGDGLFEGMDVKRADLQEVARAAPGVGQAMVALYRAYREAREGAGGAAAVMPTVGDAGGAQDEAQDFFHGHTNYFPELEEAAQQIWETGLLEPGQLGPGLATYLERELTVRVKIMPVDVMGVLHRRYDRHGRRVLLSEMLPLPARNFQMALQIGLIRHRTLLDGLVAQDRFTTEEGRRLARLGLANYLAGAVTMPYERFYRAATSVRYDIDVLRHRFEASFEQVCHRLTTLQRPGAKGVPFFMMRVDNAGNVSKRFSANALYFARFGGACPRWNVHDAFTQPKRVHLQVIEMPDGERFFSLSRAIAKPGTGHRQPGQNFAVALGCELSYAAQLVYADGMDLDVDSVAVPIGLHCRVCERLDCTQRAYPPANRRLLVDETQRGPTPYVFSMEEGEDAV